MCDPVISLRLCAFAPLRETRLVQPDLSRRRKGANFAKGLAQVERSSKVISGVSNHRQQESTHGLRRVVAAVALLACAVFRPPAEAALQNEPASIEIDAGKVEGRLSPLLYGQFAEFMFENIKGGLHE